MIRHVFYRWLVCAASVVAVLASNPAAGQERYSLEAGQWQQQTAPDPATAEGELHAIRKLLAQDEPKQAHQLAKQWVKRHSDHPLLAEAYLLKGDARVAEREYFKALFDYEYLIRAFPASEQYVAALEREYEIARLFAAGMKRKWARIFRLSAAGEAEEIFIRIQERVPGSELGEKASLALSDFYFDRAEMKNATIAYDMFLSNYPRSDYRERAMLRLIEASLATFKGPQFDPTGLIEAQQRIKQFQDEFPASAERLGSAALLVRIHELLALKNHFMAQWYDDRGRQVSAVYLYQRVVRDFSDTAAAGMAAERLNDLSVPLAVRLAPDPAPESAPQPIISGREAAQRDEIPLSPAREDVPVGAVEPQGVPSQSERQP